MPAILLLALFANTSEPPTLHLNCIGTVAAAVPVGTSSAVVADRHGGIASVSGVQSAITQQEVSVGFKMSGADAEIRLPSIMLPEAHGGKAGWFKVKKLVVTDKQITGKAAVNFLYNPSFLIDRVTGEITSSGGFHAACVPESIGPSKF